MAALRNPQHTGEWGIQGRTANWRFSLSPTLSRWEREIFRDPL